ncbi:hypothetical protein [Noviherbaspirillum denitrificans]|uniref:hypothetical protein n=1 Tax=Noviherbaspirillum denitrificans TaxID=1968433 RepID=UPI001131162B|nr:hypothetical protein [Noviherbaspirillum denitrificans]
MNFRRPTIHVVLALLLLFTQQLGISHAISHLAQAAGAESARTDSEKQLPDEFQCAKCLAFATVGSALNGTAPIAFADAAIVHVRDVVPARVHLRPPFPAFHSRAPPVVS